MEIKVMKNIMSTNEKLAQDNRAYFEGKGITAVNIMASPGAGKTSLILKVIKELREDTDIHVIEGDIASSIDAEKIQMAGIPVIQINTGGGCHLDAAMIKSAVEDLNIQGSSLLFIENVGNLVCPSAFDLGEDIRLVIASVPEGHDKPYKYLSMFEGADAIVLNKMDLKEYIDFDLNLFYKGVRALNERVPIFEVSCHTGQGTQEFTKWLRSRLKG